MANKNPLNPEEPSRSDKSTDKNKKVDGIIDELRNVLAGLGNDQAPGEPEERPLFNERPAMRDASTQSPISKSDVDEESPSDSEFWKGNVLGWPESTPTENPTPSTPPAKMSGDGEEQQSMGRFFQPQEEAPAADPEPAPQEKKEEVPIENLFSEEEPPQPPIDFEPFIPKDISSTTVNKPVGDVVPPAPLSPLDRYGTITDEVESPLPPMKNGAAHDTISIGNVMYPPPPEKEVAPPPRQEPVRPTPKHTNGRIEIGCVFPEGREKEGQLFLKNLRVYASKAKQPLDVQSVFVHAWTLGEVDVANWKTQASISGAEIVFILAIRKDAPLLGPITQKPGDSVKARLIYIEQIEIRALYADLIAFLSRSVNAKT